MKQFLRYIFVLAAVLMVAVGDVWGQTYNDGTWYSLYDLTERTKGTDTGGQIYNYTGLFTPNSGKVTFNTKMTKSLGVNPKDYSLNVGGKTVSVGSAQTSYIEKSASDLWRKRKRRYRCRIPGRFANVCGTNSQRNDYSEEFPYQTSRCRKIRPSIISRAT